MKEYETLLTKNVIWLKRTKGVGIISKEDAINWGVTGPSLRGSGVKYDVRKAFPYSSYEEFDFEIPMGSVGDVYDRYIVRLERDGMVECHRETGIGTAAQRSDPL